LPRAIAVMTDLTRGARTAIDITARAKAYADLFAAFATSATSAAPTNVPAGVIGRTPIPPPPSSAELLA